MYTECGRRALSVTVMLLSLLRICITTDTMSEDEKVELRFSYITTKTGGFVSSGSIPMVDFALEQIKNRTDILPNYTLSYTNILDSNCNHTASLDAFMQHFQVRRPDESRRPTYVSLLCCGCSTATIPVAEVSHYWNIPQVAGIAGAYILNDRERFRGFFRTLPSFEFVGPSLAQIAREFEWTQMAIITQRESLFTLVTESLDAIFKSEGRILDTAAIIDLSVDVFPYDFVFAWERDYRIIIINTNPPYAYSVLCEAYHRKMFAPKYVWITPSWYSEGWWNEDYGNLSCTPEFIKKMLSNSLAVTPNGYFVTSDDSAVTYSGLTAQEYKAEYSERLQNESYQSQNITEFILSGSSYDAVWAMALGLHRASERVKRNDSSGCDHLSGNLVKLEDFDYQNQMMGCVMRQSLHEVNFTGITGSVNFNANGSRTVNSVLVQQYHVSDEGNVYRENVADVEIHTNESKLIYKGNLTAKSLWPGGIPYDGAARNIQHPLNIVLTAVYFTLASIGLLYTLICLIFNVIFRNKKVVKLSSPNLNYIIIAGVALLYVSVFLYTISSQETLPQTLLCNFRQWLFSLGYALCFAVILTKAGRVYFIFTNPTPNRKIPKDWVLFVIIMLVVAVDVLIILIGTAIPSSRLNASEVRDVQHPSATDVNKISYNHFIFVCLNKSTVVWLSISYAYKGLLQIVAMFMAFHTRRVKIKALNDSKEIAIIIYINSITLSLLAFVEFALSAYHEVYAILFGLALLVGATLFLSLLFTPKMVHLIRDPDGKSVWSHTGHTTTVDTAAAVHVQTKSTTAPASEIDEVVQLKKRVLDLEKELHEKE